MASGHVQGSVGRWRRCRTTYFAPTYLPTYQQLELTNPTEALQFAVCSLRFAVRIGEMHGRGFSSVTSEPK
jgi:hypothetical protein